MTLRIAHDLNSFPSEISFKTRERQSWPIHRRLANDPAQPLRPADQIQSKRAGMFSVKTFNRDDVALHCHVANVSLCIGAGQKKQAVSFHIPRKSIAFQFDSHPQEKPLTTFSL